MKIKVIGDEFTCLGFTLSGVSAVAVEGESSVAEEFDKALGDDDVGIILVTEKEADMIRDKINRQKTEGEMPLVVEIPSRTGWKERGKALELIKRVLSINL
jgi:V/A-type H+-transporting ATPase subunit F